MMVPANKLVVYNAGHGWYGAMLSDSFDKIEAFLRSMWKTEQS
jgi:hypothetical protein